MVIILQCIHHNVYLYETYSYPIPPQVFFQPTFVLRPSDVAFSTFLDCTSLVSGWVKDQTNWGSPVIPQPPGCPALKSESGYFEDGSHKWACVDL